MRKMPQQGDSHKSFQFCRAAFFAFTWYSLSAKGFRIGLHDKKIRFKIYTRPCNFLRSANLK